MKQFFLSLALFLFVGAATAFACLPGGITFSSQAQIDAFTTDYPGCTHIEGNVTISGADITNLDGLEEITVIDGYLYIDNCPLLTTIDGLNGLTATLSVGISNNESLISVAGLNGVTYLESGVGFYNNQALTSIGGFNGLTSVGGNVVIYYGNPYLESITGFTSLTTIVDGYLILGGGSLTDISGFSALTLVGTAINNSYVYISFSGLSDISPLANVSTPFWRIEGNPNLSECHIQSICDHIAADGPTDIVENGVGCDNESQVEQACMGPLPTTTYVVTNTNHSGAGSLRQAMLDANADPNPSVIEFNIDGGGAHTIDGNFPSAVLNSNVTVDGTTQPGYSGTPLIEILKTAGSFRVEGENVLIKGLAFHSTGISASSGAWSNLKVEDCSFTEVYSGVSANDGADIQIINCDFDVISNGGNAVISLSGIQEGAIPKGVLAYGNTFNISYYNSGDLPPYLFSLYQMEDNLLIGNQDVAGANITIEDNAGFATTPAGCVTMGECHGVVFDNLQLVKTGDTGEQGLGVGGCMDVTVQNCTFGNLNSACSMWPCQDVRILNNTFTNCGKGEVAFLDITISDLGSNLLPNGLLMSGNQFSDIGRGIGITVEEGLSVVIGSPVTPDANIILAEDDGHDDIQTDVVYCGYGGSGGGNYTIRDLDFTGAGTMEGTGIVVPNGIGSVENCRITNFEFGVVIYSPDGVTIQCNLIYDNGTGVIRYADGNDLVENNTFADNLLAVDNSLFTTTQLTAGNNYWGGGAPALDGPNGYAGDVDTDPYLSTPPGCAPTLPTPDNDGDGYPLTADCDDNNPNIYPGAPEICNGVDDNCDGQIDEGVADSDGDGICNALDNCPNNYNPDQADNEGDGIGDVCDPNDDNDPKLDQQDCAPFDPNIYPGAPEICGNLIDDDCDNKIDEPFGIQTISEQDVLCNGDATGSITVTGTCGLPPYSYIWTNGAITATISNLVAGSYKVTVTDAQGLTKTKNHNITQPSVLNVNMTKTDASCFGGSNGKATASPSGGKSPYTYAWSNGGTTKTITGLTSGAYFVTVTDFNGCTKVGAIEVGQPTQVLIDNVLVEPDPAHPGKFQITVTASGGTPYTNGYRYRRCNSGGTSCTGWQVSNVLTNIPAGDYLVRVKDKNACEAEQLVTVGGSGRPGNGERSFVENQVFERENANPQSRVWLYPNPAETELWALLPVENAAGEEGVVEILDANGRLVLQNKIAALPGEPVQVILADLTAGAYIMLWKTQSGVLAARFIVARQ